MYNGQGDGLLVIVIDICLLHNQYCILPWCYDTIGKNVFCGSLLLLRLCGFVLEVQRWEEDWGIAWVSFARGLAVLATLEW